jgi:putative redox protein
MSQEMVISFPENLQVQAEYKNFVVKTDQPESEGGSDSAPTPFDLFLASIGTCAGVHIAFFCKKRTIPYSSIKLRLRIEKNLETNVIQRFQIEITVPSGFPDKYRNALIKTVNQCTVKRTIEAQPDFVVTTSQV